MLAARGACRPVSKCIEQGAGRGSAVPTTCGSQPGRAVATPPALTALVRDVGFGHGYRKDLYAESWALVQYLQKTRPHELMTFIDLLRNPAGMEVASEEDRYLELFRRAFGDDLDRLERDWVASRTDLQTPLERSSPGHK